MGAILRGLSGAALALVVAGAAGAESISVSPTQLVVPAGGQQAAMTVRARGAGPSVVQVRVYAWDERTAASRLHETWSRARPSRSWARGRS